jgi:hypothetical protein
VRGQYLLKVRSKRRRWSWPAVSGLLAVSVAVILPADAGIGAVSKLSVPVHHDWAQAHVTSVRTIEQPVGLPGTPYAYGITVASIAPIPRKGRLVRIDLATGQVSPGPEISSAAEELLVVGQSLAVLSPARTAPNGLPFGPYRLQLVLRAGTTFAPAVTLAWAGSTRGLTRIGTRFSGSRQR